MLELLRAHPELLSSRQFGGRSTTEALQYLLTLLYNAWIFHPGDVATVFGLDMSSAFDSVFRDRLLQNLVDKGFPPWSVTIVRSMLSDRTATMRMPGIVSPSFCHNSGIFQGSLWSSLLFSISSNPLLEKTCTGLQKVEVNGQSHWVYPYAFAFVDDIYLIAVSKSYEINCKWIEMLHSSVQAVAAELKFVFGPRRDRPDTNSRPQIPGFDGLPEPKLRILGVMVDQKLNWQCHINDIVEKVRKRLGYLSIISKRTTGPTLQTMRLYYLTMIRPVITYACGAWFFRQRVGDKGDCPVKYGLKDDQIKQLMSLHKECLTKVSGAVLDTAAEMMEKDLFVENIMEVHCMRTVKKEQGASAKEITQRDREQGIGPGAGGRGNRMMPGDKETSLASTKKKSGKAPRNNKTPYQILDAEARKIYEAVKKGRDDKASVNLNPNEVVKAKERWADHKKRSEIIKAWVKNIDTKECEARWKRYVEQRKGKRVDGGRSPKDLRLPVALTEDWGRKNLEYYSGMTRAQSTMLFACRTERIGLRKYLHDCRIPGFEFPMCPCGRSRETVFHLLVECPRLREARIGLFQQVGHNDFTTLLTKDAKVVAEWAISYFGLAMFDSPSSAQVVSTADLALPESYELDQLVFSQLSKLPVGTPCPSCRCSVAHQFPDASSQPGCDSPQQKYRYVSASHLARAFRRLFLTRPASPDDSVNRTFDSLTFPPQHTHDPSWSHSTTPIIFRDVSLNLQCLPQRHDFPQPVAIFLQLVYLGLVVIIDLVILLLQLSIEPSCKERVAAEESNLDAVFAVDILVFVEQLDGLIEQRITPFETDMQLGNASEGAKVDEEIGRICSLEPSEPLRSYSLTIEGDPDLNHSTEFFSTIMKPYIVWLTANTDCVAQGLLLPPGHCNYPFDTRSSDKETTVLRSNFTLGQPWKYDEIVEGSEDGIIGMPLESLMTGYGFEPEIVDVSTDMLDWMEIKRESFLREEVPKDVEEETAA
ncbi:hypothetical protein F52700_11418 [Fusarium sp. NRRL 52700]|nr:hypothetical protein F52700_11418 [Fusarium sp. NRRL 52700]